MSKKQWLTDLMLFSNEDRIASFYVSGENWQLYTLQSGAYVLVVTQSLYRSWLRQGLLEEGFFLPVAHKKQDCLLLSEGRQDSFQNTVQNVIQEDLLFLRSYAGEMISSIEFGPFPVTGSQAIAFTRALKASRKRTISSLADGIYISRFGLILPTYIDQAGKPDALVLGQWICGGMNIPITDRNKVCRYAPWLSENTLERLLSMILSFPKSYNSETAACKIHQNVSDVLPAPSLIDPSWIRNKKKMPETVKSRTEKMDGRRMPRRERTEGKFELPGRRMLERFFQEEIIDPIDHQEKYRRFGIGFPGPVLLHGPSGSGKTFAVEKLADYLGWPILRITSGTVGSKYVHETSQNISQIFDLAIREAPSIIIIDEIEAFVSSRENAGGNTSIHLEEVAEFLRRIPDAPEHHVLLFGMTNLIGAIDQSILRRGRFDHIIEVKMPDRSEITAVLQHSLKGLPTEGDLLLNDVAATLEGAPLSDVASVVTQAGKICIRTGRTTIDSSTLLEACRATRPRTKKKNRIGF